MASQWEFYQCQVDDEQASIYVDLAFHNLAPMKTAPEVCRLRLYLRVVREDGLSSKTEFQKLIEIEDAIICGLNDCGRESYYVGRTTSGGCRDFYVYSRHASKTADLLSDTLSKFEEYEFDIATREEADWSTYLTFLFPSPRSMQLISNSQIIALLQQNNDLNEVPRNVSHWAYFPDFASRNAFLAKSTDLGFSLQSTTDPTSPNEQWGLIIVRNDAVDYHSMATCVLALYDLAFEVGGKYDGWETQVISKAED